MGMELGVKVGRRKREEAGCQDIGKLNYAHSLLCRLCRHC